MPSHVLIKGTAQDRRERFEFTIEPFISVGFMLPIKYNGDCHHNITGAGVGPSMDRAKEIADPTAKRRLSGATITWEGHES
jgi:hypothetical protein